MSDDRARDAALTIAQIVYLGPLTKEIDRFFSDELRLRCAEDKEYADGFLTSGNGLIDWMLSNMAPVHEIKMIYEAPVFQLYEQADRRITDVTWSFVQHLAAIKYPTELFGADSGGWSSGPLKISWPSHNSLSSLVTKLIDRNHVAETGRICSFGRLDCTSQRLTEVSLGAVIFETQDNNVAPETWCSFEAVGCIFDHAAFYAANLWQANFSYCRLHGCSFHAGMMQSFSAVGAECVDCSFENADLSESYFQDAVISRCIFRGASLASAGFINSTVEDCDFSSTESNLRARRRITSGTVLYSTVFSDAIIVNTDFQNSVLHKCDFSGSRLEEVDFSGSVLQECELDGISGGPLIIFASQAEEEPFDSLPQEILQIEKSERGEGL